MADASSTRRLRWYQFRLRSLLLAMTALVLVLVAWRVYVAPHVASYRRQQQTMELIKKLGGSYQTTPAPNWLRRLTGEDFQDVELVDLADCDEPDAYIKHIAALPKLEILAVGGDNFADEHLLRLQQCRTLQGLVLDWTSVTLEGVAAINASLPDLDVHLSASRLVEMHLKRNRPVVGPFAVHLFSAEPFGTHPNLRKRLGEKFFSMNPGAIAIQASANDPWLPRLWQLNRALRIVALEGPVADKSLVYISQLTNLQRLRLRGSRVTDAGLAQLQPLQGLQEVSLAASTITDKGLAELPRFKQLSKVDLYGTKITSPGLANLAALTNLKSISLGRTQIDDAGVAHLKRLTNLTEIDLMGTQVTDAGIGHLQDLKLLTYVNLSNTKITDAALERLKTLDNLALVFLDGTDIKGPGLRHLADLPKLHQLSVTNTVITDAALAHLKNAKSLRMLQAKGTRISADAVSELQQALPNCKIQWVGGN